jgi:hypothetical protein
VSDVLSSTRKFCKSVYVAMALSAGLVGVNNAQATSINALPGSVNLAPEFSALSMPFVTDTQVESFLGLDLGELDSLFGLNLVSGTAFKNNWMLDPGDVLSFEYAWVDSGIADNYAFITIDGSVVSVIDAGSEHLLHDVFAWQALDEGSYEVGVGMVSNRVWPLSGAGLMAFNYQVTQAPASGAISRPVPLPGTLFLMGFGLLFVPFMKCRNRV